MKRLISSLELYAEKMIGRQSTAFYLNSFLVGGCFESAKGTDERALAYFNERLASQYFGCYTSLKDVSLNSCAYMKNDYKDIDFVDKTLSILSIQPFSNDTFRGYNSKWNDTPFTISDKPICNLSGHEFDYLDWSFSRKGDFILCCKDLQHTIIDDIVVYTGTELILYRIEH